MISFSCSSSRLRFFNSRSSADSAALTPGATPSSTDEARPGVPIRAHPISSMCRDTSVLFGKDWRSNRLFSLLPRCRGQCASQKNTGMLVAEVNSVGRAISTRRSQSALRIVVGSSVNARATALVTVSLVALVIGRTSR